jgi:hypothetical protein
LWNDGSSASIAVSGIWAIEELTDGAFAIFFWLAAVVQRSAVSSEREIIFYFLATEGSL